MERIKLGQVTAPVGIRGEIRVYPELEQARFSDIKEVCVEDGPPVRVEKSRPDKNMVVLKLSGTDSRNGAEALRGKVLYLPEGVEPDLGDDTYLVDRLIGLAAVTEAGETVGKIRDVITRPSQDLYEIEKADGGSFLLPAVKEFILNVDLKGGIMTVKLPEGIMDL
ncbi:MAG: 16S rRNA processing protein RimM [Firmicutes bacterium]|nr:16S rRNA processing protein RimM [Bacillota bacterium]